MLLRILTCHSDFFGLEAVAGAERLLGAAQRYHRINPELEFDIALDDVSPKSFAALRTKVRTPLPTDQPLACCEHLITVALTSAGSERLSSPQAEETDLAPTVEYIKEYFLTGEEPLWKQHDELCDWQPPSAWEESGGLQWARK